MTNIQIKDLNEQTTPVAADVLAIDQAADNITKKVQLTNLPKAFDRSGTATKLGTVTGTLTTNKQLAFDANGNIIASATDIGGGATKGRVMMQVAAVPLTLGAPIMGIDGASSPAEGIPYFEFVNGSVTYRDFYCRLYDYQGGGLTLNFEVLRTSAGAGSTYIFEAAIRRINTGTEDVTAAHTYDYNAVTVTIPAGPPAAGIPMSGTITFTNGADMDNLADGESFILRIRRNGGTATDTARVLATINARET